MLPNILKTPSLAAVFAAATTLFTASPLQATLIVKTPDLGAYYRPLSPATGSYVYSDSFVAPQNSPVDALSGWLSVDFYDPATSVRFEVWGSRGNLAANGPDSANVRASTASLSPVAGILTPYSAPTPGSLPLVAGNTYWFVVTVVGAAGAGQYQVGAHTQNGGGIVDNGTFWYSNDVTGQIFDGGPITPEMAFQVELPNPAVDTDGDGINDNVDQCPDSDLSPTVVIEGCNSGVPNLLFASGCTISDLIGHCAEDAKNHGQFVCCVVELTNSLRARGLISSKQRSELQQCAARSHLGDPGHHGEGHEDGHGDGHGGQGKPVCRR